MTKNHNYNTPAKGETDWHIPLNENFEFIDTDVEIRDKEANQGDYEPKVGAKFFATDTESMFIGDGSNWNRVASSGKNPEFNSLTTNKLTDGIAGNGNEISVIGGNIYIQNSEPSNPRENDIWIDTS